MKEAFEVTFWGVRGSHPVPGKDTLFFGGNTTSIEVRIGKTLIIIDAGTGIVDLGNKIAAEYFSEKTNTPLQLSLFFTHLHHDHTQGLPFFAPLYMGKTILHLFGPRNFGKELGVVLERSMTPPNFPIDFDRVNSLRDVITIRENNLIQFEVNDNTPALLNKYLDEVAVKDTSILIKVMDDFSHPANGVLIYRIEYSGKAIVISTDVEGYLSGNSKLIQFAKGADLLIHDGQCSKEKYVALSTSKQGFGHSTPEMAVEVAELSQVKNLAITHHDPNSTDGELKRNQTKYKRKFKNLFYAREGYTFHVD